NSGGCIERFYTIELQGAHLSNILTCYPHSITHAGNQPEEVIVLNYKNITWKHHIASTESYSCWEERVF
ncbi:type VI secretion system tube protein TssD, partial [Escherichia coli]|nr:type VI secretion system tube protein Hcp [Escherichia coli]EET9491809.1 type VI secretion system tube protein Hcp [Escherichia coli]EFA2702171.1 type VI secretion system tube protein Hcp [Escherichia coli]EFE8508027.1 type VI secretion system tube protein Hcp [Escherichia coli]EFL1849247.1 type VI secretion system tube protein Hcp [Escherichia coli]